MSRSWTRHTRLVIGASRITARSYARSWRLKQVAAAEVSVPPESTLEHRAAAIVHLLRDTTPHGTAVDIVLLDHLHRVFALPWSPALQRDQDWQRFARYRARELLGEAASQWSVQLSAPNALHFLRRVGGGSPCDRFAGAIKNGDLAALNAAVSEARGVLRTLQGAISPLLARLSASPAQPDVPAQDSPTQWCVLIEPAVLVFARSRGERWDSVSQHRITAGHSAATMGEAVSTWLDREARLSSALEGADAPPDAPPGAEEPLTCVIGRRTLRLKRTTTSGAAVAAAIDAHIGTMADLEAEVIDACFP